MQPAIGTTYLFSLSRVFCRKTRRRTALEASREFFGIPLYSDFCNRNTECMESLAKGIVALVTCPEDFFVFASVDHFAPLLLLLSTAFVYWNASTVNNSWTLHALPFLTCHLSCFNLVSLPFVACSFVTIDSIRRNHIVEEEYTFFRSLSFVD